MKSADNIQATVIWISYKNPLKKIMNKLYIYVFFFFDLGFCTSPGLSQCIEPFIPACADFSWVLSSWKVEWCQVLMVAPLPRWSR
jgi:hypothetical protein